MFQGTSSRSWRTRMNRAGARGGRTGAWASTPPTTWRLSNGRGEVIFVRPGTVFPGVL